MLPKCATISISNQLTCSDRGVMSISWRHRCESQCWNRFPTNQGNDEAPQTRSDCSEAWKDFVVKVLSRVQIPRLQDGLCWTPEQDGVNFLAVCLNHITSPFKQKSLWSVRTMVLRGPWGITSSLWGFFSLLCNSDEKTTRHYQTCYIWVLKAHWTVDNFRLL